MLGLGLGFGRPLKITKSTPIPFFNAALQSVINNTGSARILCVGDSLTFGSWSTGSNTDSNQRQFSYPAHLRNLFEAGGIEATEENIIGWGGNLTYNIEHDARVSYTGTPARTPAFTIGGGGVVLESGDSVTFAPNENVDTFKLYALGYISSGHIAYSVTGGTNPSGAMDVSNPGGNALITPEVIDLGAVVDAEITLSYTAGEGGSNCIFLGIEAYDSTKNQITIMNCGSPSAKADDWDVADKPWSPINSWDYYNPDLVLICLGANEWMTGDSAATYKSNMQNIINGILAYGGIDIALISPPPSNETTYTTQGAFRTALSELSDENNIPLIDIYAAFGGQAVGDASGYYVADDIHLTSNGYQVMASTVYDVIKP